MGQSTTARACRLWLEIITRTGTNRYTVRPVTPKTDEHSAYRLVKQGASPQTYVVSMDTIGVPHCDCPSYHPQTYCKHCHALKAAGLLQPEIVTAADEARLDAARLQDELAAEINRYQELNAQLKTALEKPARTRRPRSKVSA